MNLRKYFIHYLPGVRVTYLRKYFSSENLKGNECAVFHLCKYLQINENKANLICLRHPVINKLSAEKIKNVIITINDMGFANEVLIDKPMLFGILPVTLKFRFKVLRECGVENIKPGDLLSYLQIVKQKTIGSLKKSGFISNHINLENRLASYMTQWPTSLTNLICEDVYSLTLYSLRLKIIQRYLELVLDLSQDEFYRGIETYPTVRHRPLEIINETLQILQTQIMMPIHKIKSNLYLVHADPENLRNIISIFRTIGGIDVKEVIRMHPKLAMKNYLTMIEIKKILYEHGIGNEAQIRCFDIYTLGSDTVRERIEKARSIPEFNAFFNHPRFLKMIHYNTTAIKRLNKLYGHNKKCLSLNILSGSMAHYETYEKSPGDRLGKGKDLIFCISQSLGNKYSTSDIRSTLKRHPFWINIPLIHVKLLYQKLSTEFTPNDIFENCSILLYPWNKVRDVLGKLNKKQIQVHYPFLYENVDIDKLNKSQKLSLVLYLLEKKHYYTGNGVWSDENKNITPDLPLMYEPRKYVQNVMN